MACRWGEKLERWTNVWLFTSAWLKLHLCSAPQTRFKKTCGVEIITCQTIYWTHLSFVSAGVHLRLLSSVTAISTLGRPADTRTWQFVRFSRNRAEVNVLIDREFSLYFNLHAGSRKAWGGGSSRGLLIAGLECLGWASLLPGWKPLCLLKEPLHLCQGRLEICSTVLIGQSTSQTLSNHSRVRL